VAKSKKTARRWQDSTIEEIVDVLHNSVQFFDKEGRQNNAGVLAQIEKALKATRREYVGMSPGTIL